MIRDISVITPNYPTSAFPEHGVFVESLIREWNNAGVMVDVVAPVSAALIWKTLYKKKTALKKVGRSIVRPIYLTLSNKKIGPLDFAAWCTKSFIRSSMRAINILPSPDIYYGKFLMRGGAVAALAGKIRNRPSFADLGESISFERLDIKNKSFVNNIINSLDGLICVSDRLRNEVINLGADPNRVLFAPNCADLSRFKPLNKMECRKKLGLPDNTFIISFTGHFIERKGPLRVLSALEKLPSNVFGVFLGEGSQRPTGSRVLHTGTVPNDQIPLWLNASDIFILPTTAEGHCNAINEAVSCGIPVITSDIPDMRSQLQDRCALFINPLNVDEIAMALTMVYNDRNKLTGLASECLQFAQDQFSMSRGKRILDWIDSRITASSVK